MESLGGMIKNASGLPWHKYKNPNSKLIRNEVLGVIMPEFEQQAIKFGWIVKRAGRWMIARERIIAESNGVNHKKGDTISVVNRNYMAYKDSQRSRDFESLTKTEPEDDFNERVKEIL